MKSTLLLVLITVLRTAVFPQACDECSFPRVALYDCQEDTSDDIIVIPKKHLVNTGESVDVEITMIDCDGVPLANRRILFNDNIVQLKPNTPEMPLNAQNPSEQKKWPRV